MANVGNWIVESTATIGTGSITLAGAQIGFSKFAGAVPSGKVWYVIEDGNQKEAGIGDFNGANTLVRTTVQATLVNGTYTKVNPTPINLSGTAVVACTFNSSAYTELLNHTLNTNNPHGVIAAQIPYDPTGDPVTSEIDVQSAMLDQSLSIEQRVASRTGVISGGLITGAGVNFNVALGKGAVFDSYTNPENTSIVEVDWTAKSNVLLETGGKTFGSTLIFITSVGNILQVTTESSPSLFREYIFLGIVYYVNSTITEITNSPSVIKQTSSDLYDLMRNKIIVSGGDVKPVTSLLQLWTEAGTVLYPGLNWYNSKTNPNTFTLIQQGSDSVPITVLPMTQTGLIGAPITTMPKQFNASADVLTALVGNDACIHRLYSLGIQDSTRTFVLLYGQNSYSDANVAKSNILTDGGVTAFPAVLAAATFIGYVGIGGTATEFNNVDAWIVNDTSRGSSGAGSVQSDHTALSNRDVVNQHPIEAIGVTAGEQLRDTLDAKTKWLGEWVTGEYQPNDMVIDGSWTMIANAVTSERAGPQPIGDPFYVFDGALVPTPVSAKQILFGARYQSLGEGFLEGYRIDVVTGNAYSIFFVDDPLGVAQVNQVLSFTATSTGWVELGLLPKLVGIGETFDIVALVQEPNPTPSTFSGNWDYITPQNSSVPASGQIIQANSSDSLLLVHKTDNDAVDRSVALSGLTVGDVIDSGSVRYVIQSVTDDTTHFTFSVAPALQSFPDGVTSFTFETNVATPITYGVDIDHYIANPQVSGLLAVDSDYGSITPDNNAYGIDILVQSASVSSEWDLVARSGGTSSGGGSGGTELIESRVLYTNVAGQSSFPVTYVPPNVKVYLNGSLVTPPNYNSSSGTEVVLNSPIASSLDELEIVVYNPVQVSDPESFRKVIDVYSKAESDTGRKNYLINGSFDIWQRGNSFTSPTGFKADRWQTSSDGDGITTSRVTSPNKDTPELRNLFRMTTNTTAVTAQAWNKIEGVNSLAGKRVTLSFRHRCTAACNMRARVQQAFGTGGSSTITVLDEQVAYTSGYVTTTFSFDMPEITGKTVGVSDDDCVIVILTFQDFTGVSVVCDLVYAQLEEGSIATPFEYRPIGEELALCQRYYIKYSASDAAFAPIGVLQMFSASTGLTTVNFPVTMRTVPTLSFSDAGDFRVIGGGTLTSIAGYIYSTADEASLQGTVSGLTTGDTTLLTFNGATDWFAADAEL